jgi:histidinol-phosphate/aromatic aminotransferase/cobyric acid decarboxylase-like protein
LPTQSNFILLVDLPCPATTICAQFLQQGVMLRRTDAFNLPANLRITLAHPQENAQVIELLRQICR